MTYDETRASSGHEAQVGYRVRMWAQFLLEECSRPQQASLQRFKTMMTSLTAAQQLPVSCFNFFLSKVFLTFLSFSRNILSIRRSNS
jgi:hypothetical protein